MYLGEVSLGTGGGGYLGEVAIASGSSIPASLITGLTPAQVLFGAADGHISQSADFSFDDATDTLIAGDELTFIQSATQVYVRPQQILGAAVKGANANFESGKGSAGTAIAAGGEGGDAHFWGAEGGGDGGAGGGRGGSVSIDCGNGIAGGGEPHLSVGARTWTHTLNLGHSALTGLNLTGPINPTGPINHTGAAFASTTTGAHTLISGASSSWTVTGGLNLIPSGNLGLFSGTGQVDLVASSYRCFTPAIVLASTITPSSLGLLFTKNIALGGLAAGTTADGVLSLGNGATAPTVATDRFQLWAKDLPGGGLASFAFLTEEAIAADAALVSTHSIKGSWNGSTYKIPLVFVSTP